MAFWSRLRQSKHTFHAFANEFKRFYHLNRGPVIANHHSSPGTVVPILSNPKFIAQDSQLELFCQFRFFRKGRKSTPKKQLEDPGEPRLNEEITASMVRLVTEEGHDVISIHKAMDIAESLDMDLVEVDRKANPPVCKIFDYNKQKYLQQTKEKERAKSKTELKKGPPKEVRFTAKIKENDLKIKADLVKRLMESGYRVKCMATDPTEGVDLKSVLSRFSALIQDVAFMETIPKFEKTQAYIVVRHVKFPRKKGSGKNPSTDALSSLTEETTDSDTGHLDEDVQINESEWAVSDGLDDDGHPIFDEQNGRSNTGASVPSGIPKPEMENRYARDPKPAKQPPGTPTETNRHGPIQRNQSGFGMNTPPQMRLKQVDVPGYGAPKPDSSRSSTPNSPPKSYGIFSTAKANTTTPDEQNKPTISNRYKLNAPSDSTRSTGTMGPSPQRGPPSPDPRMSRGLGSDNQREGRR